MTVTIRVPRLRSLALVLLGAALGATLIAPVSARVSGPTAVEPTAIQTRAVSCMSYNFQPLDKGTTASEWGFDGNLRFGAGWFGCDPGLPHRAVVTRVRFLVRDASAVDSLFFCQLFRFGLTTATATVAQQLAEVPHTGSAETPGTVRLSDTSITNATVDNLKFSYRLQCLIDERTGPVDTGIYGADVTYTIDSTNG